MLKHLSFEVLKAQSLGETLAFAQYHSSLVGIGNLVYVLSLHLLLIFVNAILPGDIKIFIHSGILEPAH